MRTRLSSILLSIVLIASPLYFGGEYFFGDSWNSPFAVKPVDQEIAEGTLKFTSGTKIPSVISAPTVYTSEDNPLLLTGTVEILPNATVSFEPGTIIAASEFASIFVRGRLQTNGTSTKPVLFESNLMHPDQQTWSGILALNQSHVDLLHTKISHGAPAISCLPGSTLTGEGVDINLSLTGVYIESSQCNLSNSDIQVFVNETVTRDPNFAFTDIHISAGEVEAYQLSVPSTEEEDQY